MIHIDFSALKTIAPEHGLSPEEQNSLNNRLPEYLQKIHARKQGFYGDHVLSNEALISEIQVFADSVEETYEVIVLLGIGGSSLGTIALRDAFGHSIGGTYPELIVLDNIDPDLIAETLEGLELEKTLFLVISKSGGTPEIVSQYFFFSEVVQNAGLLEKDHFVFITGSNGILRKEADKKDIITFSIPPDVGGRFSVLTAVGLLPAALVGIDIQALIHGAQKMRDLFLSENVNKNLPFQLASIQHLLLQKGKTINVMYPYAHKLHRVADWFRQLLAESTGKKYSNAGKEIFTGITPISALGATDQHSQNQLYFEGPNDKLFLFLENQSFQNTVQIPTPSDKRLEYLKDTDFGKLLKLEMEGTKGALTEADRPHVTISLSEISEENLGALFLLLEGATAFLGEFLDINAFDQPGVELSKNITKNLLLQKNS
ncbi:glucose-6-phosphate isomerase [Candidatus Peregrinibacteria bacterium]|nr:MAG: glucose-6-phosphate isomerase [Candidatus Peregrinibacteria bacterium]